MHAYQTLPFDMVGWHSGSGSKGAAANANNNGYIGFEICEDGLTDAVYFGKVYQEAVELCAYLCKLYNLDPAKDGVLICHSEGCTRGIASNHGDVMHWWPRHGKGMHDFRAAVKALLGTNAAADTTGTGASAGASASTVSAYAVKVTASALNIRKGPGTNYAVAGAITDKGVYTIVEEAVNGTTKWGKLKSGAGWIALAYTERR